MGLIVLLGLLFGLCIAGRAAQRWVVTSEESGAFRAAVYLATGLCLGHLILAWLDLLGAPWHPLLIGALAAGALWSARRLAGPPESGAALGRVRREPSWRLDWSDLLAVVTTALFAVLALSKRIAFPDFVYHWGIKGHRYFLARGIDYDFLAREWNRLAHPEYPQLFPELYALHSIVAGRFSEASLLAWSAVFLAMLCAAGREVLRAHDVAEGVRRWSFAITVLATAMFAVAYQMAGSSDWLVALALVGALPALRRLPHPAAQLQIGVFAALAAAAKLEGIPLAAVLVAAGLWRCRGLPVSTLARAAARLAGPSVLAAAPWLIQGVRHGLFDNLQSGGLEASRASEIAAALWQSLLRPEWHLVPFSLVALPLLLLLRETRLLGAIVSLQLSVYVTRYFTATFDYEFSILSSFPRLLFHVVPAVLLALGIACDRLAKR